MVFQFQITSPECKDFRMSTELAEQHTFSDFHSLIQKNLKYESHQLASFFISDRKGLKEKEISMLDMGINGVAYFIMSKTFVSELVHNIGQKLIYTFDFLNDRSLLLELTNIIMEKNLSEPLVTLKKGNTPTQVLGEDVEVIDQDYNAAIDEKVYSYFGDLEDYTEIFGEMHEF